MKNKKIITINMFRFSVYEDDLWRETIVILIQNV